ALLIAIISVIAVCLLTPLKSVEPYVIRVDNTTGMVDIITSVNKAEFTGNEALDKYFSTTYVKAREGYYYDILQSDYELVQILSYPNVASDYLRIYEGENSRDKVLKDDYEVEVDIVSVTLGNSAGAPTATIRFNQITRKKGEKIAVSNKAKIVTLSYDYQPNTLTTEEERIKNPLGFKVSTYRVDDEIRR
ncbi:virB8 family protein, partial [Campylobacter concisus]|uniref:virB8 family protein n=1 Tax=Campylobacter concisus TaxID=199 RepID=UPI000CD855B4